MPASTYENMGIFQLKKILAFSEFYISKVFSRSVYNGDKEKTYVEDKKALIVCIPSFLYLCFLTCFS